MNQTTGRTRLRPQLLALSLLIVSAGGAREAVCLTKAAAAQQHSDSFEEHLKQSRQAYDAAKYGQARDEAKLALKLNQESPEANLMMALALRNLRKSDDAAKYASKAIQYRQGYAEAHYLLAVLFYERRDWDKAATELETGMRLGARFANAFILKGTLEVSANQQQAAIDSYKEALRVAGLDAAAMADIKQRVAALEALQELSTHRDDPAYKGPKPLNFPMPRYTEDARVNKVQGVVNAAALVDEQGKVTTIVVLAGLGHGLDEEAVRVVSRLKFSPATKDGKATPAWQSVQIEFAMK